MPYPEIMIHGMRQELARLGIEETKTPEAVKEAVEKTDGTVMVAVQLWRMPGLSCVGIQLRLLIDSPWL